MSKNFITLRPPPGPRTGFPSPSDAELNVDTNGVEPFSYAPPHILSSKFQVSNFKFQILLQT